MESAQPPASQAPSPAADSLSVIRHRWWVVGLATLLGLVAAGAWTQTQELVWESTTSVLVNPVGRDINVVGGRTQGQVNLDTEAQLVHSTAVAAGAAELLPDSRPEELARRVTVEVPPNTSVLMITFGGPTPQAAQAGSLAFAEAYLQHREQAARAELAAQTSTIEVKIEELNGSLAEINNRLAGALPGSAAAANLESQRTTVINQLNTMTGRLDELATSTVTAGTVISEARLPVEPSGPQPALILASGAALGLVLGVAGAGLAERLARRVHRPADVTRRLGVPVLAALSSAIAPHRDEIASPYGQGGRAFDRLRNEVVAMGAGLGGGLGNDAGGRVIVVTSATAGAASGLTAANLAASLSRSGHEVVLVGARGPQDAGGGVLPRLLGVTSAPGLSEVLAGRLPVVEALQRSPRQPRMQAITMGATATATGLLQSPALRAALATLARRAGYVVVDAPPTSTSADAQSLASHADTALLVVEQRRTRLADLADAVDQLRRVGTPLLAAVVMPALRGERDPDRRFATGRVAAVADPANPDATVDPAADLAAAAPGDPGTARPGSGRPARPRRYPVPTQSGGGAVPEPPAATDPDGQTIVLPRITENDRPDEGAGEAAPARDNAAPREKTVPRNDDAG